VETLRGRLTAWYATALTLALVGFAVALYMTRRHASYQELDRRVASEAELTAGILSGVSRAGGAVIQRDPSGRPALVSELAATLEAVPDFLMIVDSAGDVLFASSSTQLIFEQFEQLRQLILDAGNQRAEGTVAIIAGGPTLRYLIRPLGETTPVGGAVLAGASPESAELGLQPLLTTILLILPLGVLAAYVLGWWLAFRAVQPVDRIITEVREITDGRSLHRRLPVPLVKDEVGRLAETLNQMLNRLERSFSALRRFTADASHELKTPLTVLRAGVERAITTRGVPAETLAALEETLQEINRMTELVDTLLTLARADEGIVPLHREPVDLRTLVEEAAETGELLAEKGGVRMGVSTPAEPIVIGADASRIRQLLLNLLTNAVKYTPPGGRVRLWLERSDSQVRLGVSDTGIGIAPGDLPHVFDRFWRADSARTRTSERPGVGLGLAICKWIAEAHGGTIEAYSRPGRGTTFTVTLPAQDTAHPHVIDSSS
jgi:two-component system OmpR family sensor kinase